ncbi:MAG TPA: hypothetical protein VFP39_08815 [Gemmatimonadales bacterium]|nr:hypothetical protein [Gemmatimonadales bacterium]
MHHRVLFRLMPGALAVLVLAVACRARGPAPGAFVLQISARHPPADSAPAVTPVGRPAPRSPLVYGDSFVAQGRDTIFLRRVRLVLMEMAIAPSVANECEVEEGEDNPPCVDFHEDAFVLEVPLGRGSVRSSVEPAPATEYNLFQLIIHKPDSAQDAALLRANPDLRGASVRVDGVVSRAGKRHDFVFMTPFNEQEEIALEPAVVVPPHDTLRITLHVDVGSWFTSGDHQTLLDPATAAAGGPDEHTVKDNIRTSLKVLRDE